MDLTPQIHHYLTAAPASHFRGQAVTLIDHWQGHDNLLWRVACGGREAVLKLYLDAGQVRGRRQYEAHERFAPLGIAPRPLWFDRYPEGLSRQVLVYEWTPGESPNPADTAQMAAFGQSVGRVHAGDPSAVRRISPHPLNLDYLWRVLKGGLTGLPQWLEERKAPRLSQTFTQLATAVQSQVEQALPLWQGVAPAPAHGDLLLENTLASLGATVLLDWEFFGLSDPAFDAARFLHRSDAALDETARATWLDAYLTTFSQPGLAQRIAVYERVLHFEALCFLLNGVRTHFGEGADQEGQADAAPFLAATLAATLERAANAFAVPLPDTNSMDIQGLFAQA